MADLNNLFQVAPGTASFFTGQQFAQERDSEALKQRELEQLIANRAAQETRTGELHPFELDQRRLANQTTEAQLPGVQANSTLNSLKARMAGENYDVDSKAARAKSEGDYEEEQVKKAQRVHDFLLTTAPELESVPPPLRGQYLSSKIDAYGFNRNSPQVQRTLQMVGQDPDGAPGRLKQESDKLGRLLANRNPAHLTAADTADSHERVARGNNATSVEVAKINAASRVGRGGGASLEIRLRNAKTPREKAEILESAYAEARKAGDDTSATEYAVRAMEARQRAAEDFSNQGTARPGMDIEGIKEGEIRARPGPAAAAPIAGSGGGSPAPKPQGQKPPSLTEIQQMYPGVPPDKLKEAFKKKFGVDLQ